MFVIFCILDSACQLVISWKPLIEGVEGSGSSSTILAATAGVSGSSSAIMGATAGTGCSGRRGAATSQQVAMPSSGTTLKFVATKWGEDPTLKQL